MFNPILLVIFFAILITAFVNLKRGVEWVIIYKLIIPSYVTTDVLGLTISGSFWLGYILIALFVVKHLIIQKAPTDKAFFKPFLFFVVASFFITVFGSEIDIGAQIKALLVEILSDFSIAYIIWHIYKTKKDVNVLILHILICIAVMSIYGVYCFAINGNPYIAVLNIAYKPTTDVLEIYSDFERGALLGRLQSTTTHPMTWAGFTCLLCLFIFFILNTMKNNRVVKTLLVALLVLVAFNMLVTGTRSAIGALGIGSIVLFYYSKVSTKFLIVIGIVFVLLLGLDTSIFGKYQALADSTIFVWNKQKTGSVEGSTLDMRLRQLNGAIDLIGDGTFLFGKGYSWTQEYLKLYGDHPILLAFESIFFVVLIETGVVGIFIWSWLFIGMTKKAKAIFKLNRWPNRLPYTIISTMILTYVLYILFTGICLTLYFFFILYVIMAKIMALYGPASTANTAVITTSSK